MKSASANYVMVTNNIKINNQNVNFKSAYHFKVSKELFSNPNDENAVRQFFYEAVGKVEDKSLIGRIIKTIFKKAIFKKEPKAAGFLVFPGYSNIKEILKLKGTADFCWLKNNFNTRYGHSEGCFRNKTKLEFLDQDENIYDFYMLTGKDKQFYLNKLGKMEASSNSFAEYSATTSPEDFENRVEEEWVLKNISQYFDKMIIFKDCAKKEGLKIKDKFNNLDEVKKSIIEVINQDELKLAK